MSEVQDKIATLKAGLQQDLSDAQTTLASAQHGVDSVTGRISALADVEASLDAYGQERYKAGQDSMVLPTPADPAVQYTQAQVDQIVAQTQADKDADFALVQKTTAAQISDLQAQVTSLTAKVTEVQSNFAQYREQMIAKMATQEAEESASEAAVLDFAKTGGVADAAPAAAAPVSEVASQAAPAQ